MWNSYEIASGLDIIPDEVRKATLQVVMGQECFSVLQSLNLTQAKLACSVAIVSALNEYFLPKTNVIYKLYKFNTRNQVHHETIDEYVSALRHFVASCELGNLKDDLIHDQIVLDIYDNNLRARLLREDESTLSQAIDFCRSFKQVKIQMKQMKKEQDVVTDVNEVTATTLTNKVRRNNAQSKVVSCKFCGNKRKYGRKFYPAFGKRCFNCNKMNQFSKACTQLGDRVKYVKDQSHQLSSDDSLYYLELVSNVSPDNKQWFINLMVRVNDCPQCEVKCQLNCGSTCNTMGYAQCCKLARSNAPKLENSHVKLRVYNGLIIKSLGKALLQCMYAGKRHDLTFQILSNNVVPLLSAQSCSKLGLVEVRAKLVASK